MNLFQIIALLVLGLLLVITVAVTVRERARKREGFAWVIVWLAAGVAIAWPDITTKIAHLLGIRRGADLVFYCAVVVMLVGFLMVYVRFRRMQRELTLIVRHLAIRDATDTSCERKGNDTPVAPDLADNPSPAKEPR